MEMTKEEKIRFIANTYGRQKQSCQLMEECGELIQAMNKVKRCEEECKKDPEKYRDALVRLNEEMEHVDIMIDQVRYLYGIRTTERYGTYALDREIARIKKRLGKLEKDVKIYAVDFDGTLNLAEYPRLGKPNTGLIKFLEGRRRAGDKIILWTCREGDLLKSAVKYCKNYGLEFDAVNNNLPELIERFGNNCRKIYADYYIDDKNLKGEWHEEQ